jgi:hypothetical protein
VAGGAAAAAVQALVSASSGRIREVVAVGEVGQLLGAAAAAAAVAAAVAAAAAAAEVLG